MRQLAATRMLFSTLESDHYKRDTMVIAIQLGRTGKLIYD